MLKLSIVVSTIVFASVALADECGVTAEQAPKLGSRTAPLKEQEHVEIDRSQRTNPLPNSPSQTVGGGYYGEASRYRTDQGWSRGRGYWWHSGHSSDIPTTGYTANSDRH
ncbi:MAG: hypothetical protein KDD60_06570 [Bdellovibrionales bacterium]|nr:hypothetical protein [Bdellovibrionales bacterium]